MVNLILISHSEKLAEGLKELLKEMAPSVPVYSAAGLPDGKLGTDASRIEQVLSQSDSDALVLADIGSAVMNAEMAIDMYSGNHTIRFADVPLVEGSFLAAVQSSQNHTLMEIEKALQKEFS
ncbi:PTS-dependent dihydroxyacetone kinase phosphotransferase subunit DhaM [Metabacillus sp. GX 13764]|uniref:dihydroxyacetone kinase phosphoryl donor subunit DhaM n=1 Tax=Metabacillus kandeliae TaxID=2900151 RepID=UPI001E624D95|nr:dihydroxyacetone kinase phosphoryl donor subunit DhaM [Metabacillus kandeliae]MCD7035566.1 PTS-dependent dihydroxyacetone kinase phosphotransferase subunit DhaM [Metabacillus kandeliae]